MCFFYMFRSLNFVSSGIMRRLSVSKRTPQVLAIPLHCSEVLKPMLYSCIPIVSMFVLPQDDQHSLCLVTQYLHLGFGLISFLS